MKKRWYFYFFTFIMVLTYFTIKKYRCIVFYPYSAMFHKNFIKSSYIFHRFVKYWHYPEIIYNFVKEYGI
ncbi:hypothetical protein HMPREF3213_01656 [Heyndrickxia coagulans]|uniref:Uncharacterized protein n=1 Tax=Heyndrickxia coagulans TaxID=1398 RepID=A0A133KSZ7_HEYCO|nr:hypothetical protein HMPREF3213_01656 [Heyndrickxia coagulans]